MVTNSTVQDQVQEVFLRIGVAPNPTVIAVLCCIVTQTGVSAADILSRSQKRQYCYARHLLFYVLNTGYKYTPATIATMLDFHESAVGRGIKNIETWKGLYAYIKNDIQLITKQLNIG